MVANGPIRSFHASFTKRASAIKAMIALLSTIWPEVWFSGHLAPTTYVLAAPLFHTLCHTWRNFCGSFSELRCCILGLFLYFSPFPSRFLHAYPGVLWVIAIFRATSIGGVFKPSCLEKRICICMALGRIWILRKLPYCILLGEFAFHGIMYKVVARPSSLQEVCRNNHQTTISIHVALKVTSIDACIARDVLHAAIATWAWNLHLPNSRRRNLRPEPGFAARICFL
jgi:hypothetical protein